MLTSPVRSLARLMRPHAVRWVIASGLVAVGAGGSVLGPILLASTVDATADGATAGEIRRLGAAFVIVAAVAVVTTVGAVYAATSTAWRTTNELRVTLTSHVLGLDLEFHRTHSPGEMISRVDGDVTAVSDFLSHVLVKAIRSVTVIVGAIVVLAVRSWPLAVAFAGYVGVAVLGVLAVRHRAVAESADDMGAHAALYGGIEERLNASVDLRANAGTDYALARFVDDSRSVMTSTVARIRAFQSLWSVVLSLIAVGKVASIVIGAWLVASGRMTVGTALLVFQFILLIATPLEEIVRELQVVQKAVAGMTRVAGLLDESSSIVDSGGRVPPPGALSVSFDRVSFDYGDGETVLHDVSVDIESGRSVGIIGRTGSGKTTFSRLVLRLIEATAGTVSIGGVAIGNISLAELRRRTVLIPQEVELFGASVRDNVTMFNPAPSDDDVVNALTAVGLERLVTGGIERQLGSGGTGLSAGEAQLMSLARAWLRNPDLIVLDEPTARVDPDTDAAIAAAVRELTRDRTTFIIAHRLETLDTVDQIAVFDGGRLVEFGDRARLAGQVSRYARLLDIAVGGGEAR